MPGIFLGSLHIPGIFAGIQVFVCLFYSSKLLYRELVVFFRVIEQDFVQNHEVPGGFAPLDPHINIKYR